MCRCEDVHVWICVDVSCDYMHAMHLFFSGRTLRSPGKDVLPASRQYILYKHLACIYCTIGTVCNTQDISRPSTLDGFHVFHCFPWHASKLQLGNILQLISAPSMWTQWPSQGRKWTLLKTSTNSDLEASGKYQRQTCHVSHVKKKLCGS